MAPHAAAKNQLSFFIFSCTISIIPLLQHKRLFLHQHQFTFSAGAERLQATIDYVGDTVPQPSILSLHGGGDPARRLIAPLARHLAANGHPVLRFDHSGWGESSGTLQTSSLRQRVEEAQTAAQFLNPDHGITVIGTSMGGHIALELLQHLNVRNLILFCPAAYTAKAYDVPFGPDFSTLIRDPDSYRNATVFEHLERFTGQFMMLNGTDDPIIPVDVIAQYKQSARHCSFADFVTLEGAPHRIMEWLAEHPPREQDIFARITRLVA